MSSDFKSHTLYNKRLCGSGSCNVPGRLLALCLPYRPSFPVSQLSTKDTKATKLRKKGNIFVWMQKNVLHRQTLKLATGFTNGHRCVFWLLIFNLYLFHPSKRHMPLFIQLRLWVIPPVYVPGSLRPPSAVRFASETHFGLILISKCDFSRNPQKYLRCLTLMWKLGHFFKWNQDFQACVQVSVIWRIRLLTWFTAWKLIQCEFQISLNYFKMTFSILNLSRVKNKYLI